MKIAGMVVWALTAGIGVYLLAAVIAGHRQPGASPADTDSSGAGPADTDSPGAGPADTDSPGAGPADTDSPGARPPASGAPAETALLEFSHPALALTGLTFWIFFVVTSARVFAWIALGVVVATILAGLTWAVTGWRGVAAARIPGSAPDESALPVRLMLIHGLAAACTLSLVVIALVVARG